MDAAARLALITHGRHVSRRMENYRGRAHDTAAPVAGRSGERCTREHWDTVLGRGGAWVRRARSGCRPRLSRTDRLRRAPQTVEEAMSRLYQEGHRELQREFDTERLAGSPRQAHLRRPHTP